MFWAEKGREFNFGVTVEDVDKVGVADHGGMVGDEADTFVFEGLKVGLVHDLGASKGLGDEGEEECDHGLGRSLLWVWGDLRRIELRGFGDLATERLKFSS